MKEIDDLVDALAGLGSPFLRVRRPGLSPDEVREEALQYLPEGWAEYIDDDVCAWYGWHNGADPEAQRAEGQAGEACQVITPDGFTLKGIRDVLSFGWTVTEPEYAPSMGIVFPLGPLDGVASEIYLYKETLDGEWTVGEHVFGDGVGELESGGRFVGRPTFRDWLTALTDAIDSRRLVLGRRGDVTVPGEGIKRTELHSYPWLG